MASKDCEPVQLTNVMALLKTSYFDSKNVI